MGKIALVNPPRSLFGNPELSPPLGIYTIASSLQSRGIECEVVDLNKIVLEEPVLHEPKAFYDVISSRLLDLNATCYGFTSMAVDSHVALELARIVKEARPDVTTILGGAHFSASASAMLKAFPWIDRVCIGRDDHLLLEASGYPSEAATVAITPKTGPFRPTEPNRFPFLSCDLVPYFRLNPTARVDFEWSSGCKYNCAFCYSPTFYGSIKYRAVDETVECLLRLQSLGAKEVFFVDDNFVNDWVRTLAFCEALRSSNLKLRWHCYATLPDLTPERLTHLASAGCISVFMGVDVIGKQGPSHFRKRFVRETGPLWNILNCARALGVTVTTAFLFSPPSHAAGGDFEDTSLCALESAALGAAVRINTLTPFNGTDEHSKPYHQFSYDPLMVELLLEVPKVVRTNPYATKLPHLFPFHARYVRGDEWENFLSLSHCLQSLLDVYPVTLSELYKSKGIPPAAIAQKVLDYLPPLLTLNKNSRRTAELAVATLCLSDLGCQTVSDNLSEQAVLARTLDALEPLSVI